MDVYLINVHLTGVHLMGVHLMGVHLIGVYLIGRLARSQAGSYACRQTHTLVDRLVRS